MTTRMEQTLVGERENARVVKTVYGVIQQASYLTISSLPVGFVVGGDRCIDWLPDPLGQAVY